MEMAFSTKESSNLLKTENVTLSWHNITVTVPSKKSVLTRKTLCEPITVLNNVSGTVQPGCLLAIMGSSGSGKTTLLNVLTRRSSAKLLVGGKVKVNGRTIGSSIAKMSAYVQQDDLFMGTLTVREHLWFQAMLRMDESLTDGERNRRVDEVIAELGLVKCQDTVIGIPDKVKSISGGERKRLSFASEILNNPALMFCDEPTSGLDSFMAENVVQTLRTMASHGKTILCTIHQPSSQIFNLFDNVLLMAHGHVAYIGSTAGAADFFAQLDLVCPPKFNPADFYVNCLAIVPGQESHCLENVKAICKAFEDSRRSADFGSLENKAGMTEVPSVPALTELVDYSKTAQFKTGFFNQMRCVGWRAWVASMRDRQLFMARFFPALMIALFTGFIYFNQPNSQQAIQNINGVMFLVMTNATFGNAFSVLTTFPLELALFKREHQNGMYSASVYFITRSIADIPIFILLPVMSSSIIYWMAGLKDDRFSFLIFVGTVILLTHVVISFAYFVSCAAGDVKVATALAGPLIAPLMMFGGFMLNDSSVPVYFVWLQHVSWFKYAYEILVVNQWHGFGEIGCGYGANLDATLTSADFSNDTTQAPVLPPSYVPPCVKNGDQVLTQLNYSTENVTRNFLCLTGLLVAFRLAALLCLMLRVGKVSDFWPCCRRRSQSDDDNVQPSVDCPNNKMASSC